MKKKPEICQKLKTVQTENWKSLKIGAKNLYVPQFLKGKPEEPEVLAQGWGNL